MPNGIRAVSADEFGAKINKVFAVLGHLLGQIIIPFAIFGLLLALGLLLVGSVFHHKMLKKLGWVSVGSVISVVILYYSSPLWIGFAKTIGNILGN